MNEEGSPFMGFLSFFIDEMGDFCIFHLVMSQKIVTFGA
jgi:hypothetical protein